MFKNVYFRLGLISAITTIAILIALPRVPIKINTGSINFESSIGGYFINIGKTVIDLRDLKKGLDLEGGVRIVLKAKMDNIDEVDRDSALESAKEVIDRRINLLGVTEPYIATVKAGDEYRLIVEIPGVENVSQAVDLIGQTAQLKFKQLKPDREWTEEKYLELFQDPEAWEETSVTGADLRGVDVTFGQGGDVTQQGRPQIQLKFSDGGREKFSDLAKANVGKPVALYLDQDPYPLSMPIVSPDLAEGVFNDPVISGTFDIETAKNLSINLRAGALPIPVEVLQQETIGATLGDDSVQKSFFAGIVGLVLVFLFLVYKYNRLGFLAGVSVLIYTVIVLAIFKLIPVVLTLPGIAGVILSIGMAVDANILIFERMNEEILWGKPKNLALKLGFERAWNSIRDSNFSSLITALILFNFGTGPVRGFALTLMIGILVSLFTSIFVVRTLIEGFNVIRTGGTDTKRRSPVKRKFLKGLKIPGIKYLPFINK
jgi:preprotein translocase subunit SecD